MSGLFENEIIVFFKTEEAFCLKIWGRAFRTQIGQSTFFVLSLLCLGGYGKHVRALRTQICLHFFYLGQFGYGKHGRA